MSTLRPFFTRPIRAKKIILAVGHRCELCGSEQALDDLLIDTFLDEDLAEEHPPSHMEGFLLVLCFRCHSDLQEFKVPGEELDILIRQRDEAVRQKIREILEYNPKPYTPPDVDI